MLSAVKPFLLQRDRRFDQQNDFDFEINQRSIAIMAGAVAILLPITMLIGGDIAGLAKRDSLSHYYYVPFLGDLFVGGLFSIGMILMSYSGQSRFETYFTRTAGALLFLVALFPTNGTGIDLSTESQVIFARPITQAILPPISEDRKPGEILLMDPNSGRNNIDGVEMIEENFFVIFDKEKSWHFVDYFQKTAISGIIHYGSAAFVFLFLAIYTIIFIRETEDDKKHDQKKYINEKDGTSSRKTVVHLEKKARNTIYILCGAIILSAIAVLGYKALFDNKSTWWSENDIVFWAEAIALWAFGTAWMVRGRVYDPIVYFWLRFLTPIT